MSAFVRQFYLQTDFIPRQVHLSVDVEDAGMIAEWLSAKAGARVRLAVSRRGIKARAQEMADENAAHLLEERRLKRELRKGEVPQSVAALQRATSACRVRRAGSRESTSPTFRAPTASGRSCAWSTASPGAANTATSG